MQTEDTMQNILIVAAHCDDIEAGSGGSVALWTGDGRTVRYLLVTDSGSGSNRPGEDLEKLVRTRKKEQSCAAEILGVDSVEYLAYSDGMLEPTMELRRDITRVIRKHKPDTIVTFDPEMLFSKDRAYINHPDHVAVGKATVHAAFPSAGSRPIFPELLTEGFEPHDPTRLVLQFTNRPNTVVDVSSTLEQKLAALRCHSSQLSADFIEIVRGWARDAAKDSLFDFGEEFRVVRF